MRKKLLIFIFTLIFILSGSKTWASGEDNLPTKQEYLELVNEGILDRTITYDQFYELQKISLEYEKEMEEEDTLQFFGSNQNYKLQAGDIFVTNSYSSSSLIGHAGIVISSKEILSIDGWPNHPSTKTLNQWIEQYVKKEGKWINVYRYKYSSDALKAAKWAINNYIKKNSNASYAITKNHASTNPTYCSKIVWQAYRYGIPKKDIITPIKVVLPLRLSHYINPSYLVKKYR